MKVVKNTEWVIKDSEWEVSYEVGDSYLFIRSLQDFSIVGGLKATPIEIESLSIMLQKLVDTISKE